MSGNDSGSVREALAKGHLCTAARLEARACERDGYDVTAALLLKLADQIEESRSSLFAIRAIATAGVGAPPETT